MNKLSITARKIKILIIDDDPAALNLLASYLKEGECEIFTAVDMNVAVAKIAIIPDIDLIILAHTLSLIDKREFVKLLRKEKKYSQIPLILPANMESNLQIFEEIQAGIYYYLVKPYDKNVLMNMINTVLQEAIFVKEIAKEMKNHTGIPSLMSQSEFEFTTINEAKVLACFIARAFPDPDIVAYGLTELMLNAIEHGNLGITYDEKSMLIDSGRWQEEINRRLVLPENKHKTAILTFKSTPDSMIVSIKDQGEGFQWRQYLDLAPSRMTHPNGRGVATAKLSFTTMEYCEKGNEVVCTVLKK